VKRGEAGNNDCKNNIDSPASFHFLNLTGILAFDGILTGLSLVKNVIISVLSYGLDQIPLIGILGKHHIL
jgi:hypothetical protein